MVQYKIDANVLVTPDCFRMIDELYVAYEEYFPDGMSVFRMGLAIALAQELEVDRSIKATEPKGLSNSFLMNGKVEALLRLFKIEGNPLIEGQFLAEAGVRFLHQKHQENIEIRNFLIA
jgi:hypothetical protein